MKNLRTRVYRAAAQVLVPALVVSSFPMPARGAQPPEEAASAEKAAGLAPEPLGGPATTLGQAPSEPPKVKVNRQVPKVAPPKPVPVFSAEPTDEEIFQARVFAEPLVPSRPTSITDNQALAEALRAYLRASTREDVSALRGHLAAHPGSPWRLSLLTNLGVVYRRTGYFSRAIGSFEEVWHAAKGATEPRLKAVADTAVGELAALYSRLGRESDLDALFAELESRPVRGPADGLVTSAREARAHMRSDPGDSFRCGPLALQSILSLKHPERARDPLIDEVRSTPDGTSLAQLQQLVDTLGMPLQMARREGRAPVPVPSVVHWKAGHFAALLREDNGRYLAQDPTFGEETWISRDAIDDEASGSFLVPKSALGPGWRVLEAAEAARVWGKGLPTGANQDDQGPTAPQSGGNPCGGGMAAYRINTLLASLYVADAPLSYSPPVGPSVGFQVSYNERESFQPQIFFYSNLGPKWTFDWISYVEDDPDSPAQTVSVYLSGGGREPYTSYNAATQTYAIPYKSQTELVRTSAPGAPVAYERRYSDGSVDVFAQPDGSLSFPRKVFLTERRDAQGNALTFTYDASLRLVAVTDAIGQVTTLSHDLPGDPLKITRVTDPFGRSALFDYDAAGRLTRITDVIGIASELEYEAGDLIAALITPYGTTRFTRGVMGLQGRWIEVSDPLGGRERVEHWNNVTFGSIDAPDPLGVPPGFEGLNDGSLLHKAATFYWDKRAMALAPGDHRKAEMTTWLFNTAKVTVAVPRAVKKPLESRVWYRYPGQVPFFFAPGYFLGTSSRPSRMGRFLGEDPDGPEGPLTAPAQVWQYEYNARGLATKAIDPVGRETVYVYGTNNVPDPDPATGMGQDLLQARQKNGSGYDVIETRTYNAQHLPLTVADAAGQTTTYTYTADGRIETIETPPRDGLTQGERTTTYTYDSAGYLQSVRGPDSGGQPGPTTTYAYDGYGRVRTVTDPDGYTVTMDYDAADRPVRTTYPDGTYEEVAYDRLDVGARRDRLGRWTRMFHDPLRRVTVTRDAAGRTVTQDWCNCGSLDKLIDANGNATRWERDLQGRVTKEFWPDGKFREYIYEALTSRLRFVLDPVKDPSAVDRQTKRYAYDLDDKLTRIDYFYEIVETPDVAFGYRDSSGAPDPHGRLLSMLDGTGTTSYSYHPVGGLGALRLSSVDGPLTADEIAYQYDELGRVEQRTIGGVAPVTWSYDSLGRLATETTPIGTFTYGYDGVTGRVLTLDYPNGQQAAYAYWDNLKDHRLQQIHNHLPASSTTISKFDYEYDAVGNIAVWRQQAGAEAPKEYHFGYDRADQLTLATLQTTDPTPAILKRYAYSYDPAGNRTAEQVDDTVTGWTYDNRNRLVSQGAGSLLRVAGTVNEPAAVTVQGVPAPPAATPPTGPYPFQAETQRTGDQFTIAATDATGHTRTSTYQLATTPGASKSFTFDDNGNMTSDGTRTFEWDAENRLVEVKQGGNTLVNHAYDGYGRRYQDVRGGGVTHTFLQEGSQVVEERTSTGGSIRYIEGIAPDHHLALNDESGTASYFSADHRASITEVTSNAGTVMLSREYDPWGNLVSGSDASGYAFTGREWDPEARLHYYRARDYDPRLGRFISADPIGLAGGDLNFYSYVWNRPTRLIDPAGTTGLETAAGVGGYQVAQGIVAGQAAAQAAAAGAAAAGSAGAGTAATGAAAGTGGAAAASVVVPAVAVAAAAAVGYGVGTLIDQYIIEPVFWPPPPRPQAPVPPIPPPPSADPADRSATSKGNVRNQYNDRAREQCGNDKDCICKLLECWYDDARKKGDTKAAQQIKTAQKADGCRGHR